MSDDKDVEQWKQKQKEVEKKWITEWVNTKLFEPAIDKSKPKFFMTVPYPYANSILHIGHGRTFTTADIYARYKRLKGFNVLFPMAFHISGTPVLAVADCIAKKDPKQMQQTREAISMYVKDQAEQDAMLAKFSDPMEIANFFSSKIKETFQATGLSIDWTRSFNTGEPIYNRFVEWQFHKLKETGIIAQGNYPILYSAEDKNAVGEDDIKDGDTNKVKMSEMVSLKFKLKQDGEPEYMVASTLRPETIFGITNVWINPKSVYVKTKVGKARSRTDKAEHAPETWIVSKDSILKLQHQFHDVHVLSEHSGEEFVGKQVIAPFTSKVVRVIRASFVDPDHGTGVVYSVPSHAPFDYLALRDAQKRGDASADIEMPVIIDIIEKGKALTFEGGCPAAAVVKKLNIQNQDESEKIDAATKEVYKDEFYKGKMNSLCGEFSGMKISELKEKVKEKLIQMGAAHIFHETTRKAITRKGDKVIVAVLEGQWFLDYSPNEIKEKAYGLLESMDYWPQHLKETQKTHLGWVEKRPCARKRGLGTPFPFDKSWVIESLSDSTIYQMLYTISNVIRHHNIPAEALTTAVFDYVFLGKGDPQALTVSHQIAEEMREQLLFWKSFDLRYTTPPHMSNHLSFLIYHYGLIYPQDLHPKNITVGGLLMKDGKKISKSNNNGIPLIMVPQLYGMDLYRLYVAVGSSYEVEMNFRDSEILQIEKKFMKWCELMEAAVKKPKEEYSSFKLTSRWLISKFYSYAKKYFSVFETMQIREAVVGLFYEFLNDIAYHENRTSYEDTLRALRFVAMDYIKLMTPVTPHICEELYTMMPAGEKNPHEKYASVATFTTDVNQYIDKQAEGIEQIVQDLLTTVASKIKKETKTVLIVQAPSLRFALFDKLKALLEQTRNHKDVMKGLEEFLTSADEKKFVTKFVPKTLGFGLDPYLSKPEEAKLFESLIPYLKATHNVEIKVVDAESMKASLKDAALINIHPGKPMILTEDK